MRLLEAAETRGFKETPGAGRLRVLAVVREVHAVPGVAGPGLALGLP